jgi:hypothetical protein
MAPIRLFPLLALSLVPYDLYVQDNKHFKISDDGYTASGDTEST